MAGQRGQQLAGDGAERPFDLAPAAGFPGGGLDELDPQIRAHLRDVGAGKVRPVVAVHRGRQPADRPAAPPAVYAANHRCAVRNGTPAEAADRISGTPSNTCGPSTDIRLSRSPPTASPLGPRSTTPNNPTKLRQIIRPDYATYRDS